MCATESGADARIVVHGPSCGPIAALPTAASPRARLDSARTALDLRVPSLTKPARSCQASSGARHAPRSNDATIGIRDPSGPSFRADAGTVAPAPASRPTLPTADADPWHRGHDA